LGTLYQGTPFLNDDDINGSSLNEEEDEEEEEDNGDVDTQPHQVFENAFYLHRWLRWNQTSDPSRPPWMSASSREIVYSGNWAAGQRNGIGRGVWRSGATSAVVGTGVGVTRLRTHGSVDSVGKRVRRSHDDDKAPGKVDSGWTKNSSDSYSRQSDSGSEGGEPIVEPVSPRGESQGGTNGEKSSLFVGEGEWWYEGMWYRDVPEGAGSLSFEIFLPEYLHDGVDYGDRLGFSAHQDSARWSFTATRCTGSFLRGLLHDVNVTCEATAIPSTNMKVKREAYQGAR